jgi:hypothetical protein
VDDDLDLLGNVRDALVRSGITCSIEYPGALAITVTETYQVWTGLTGWDYGTGYVLDGDETWQPDERFAMGEPVVALNEDETDPEVIAGEWAGWVANWHETRD